MTDAVTYRSDVTVRLDDWMGDDAKVIRMAKASIKRTGGDMDSAAREGFINFLARERHGVPFEHAYGTFYIEAPLRVLRQMAKHRHTSISEWSGRYSVLEPVFFLADRDRHLVQAGKPGAYRFQPGSADQWLTYVWQTTAASEYAWRSYQAMLNAGIARELARDVLGVGIYTSAYVTLNARAMMHFLSLRTSGRDYATLTSHPQAEIELVADGIEAHLAAKLPAVHAAFEKYGRVAP
ncbi:FAD-dependent thymidylate synthase [Micromonospora sp. WMMD961]|uniref:FAD-dependent thymidylate synthase n=1 Tax=Micromonospora sp. WMMD961 TaxID=3016100 RepID=UPI002415F011|nr:FAD-dependent thymidylate synthase [Micromonospora sp. WMMD961]MDG4783289.1 FAD-dependent thymidylate synthase [Micromonospora sp. WMMD961]